MANWNQIKDEKSNIPEILLQNNGNIGVQNSSRKPG